MDDLLVSIVFALCLSDDNTYRVQNEEVNCHEYYVNCIVNKRGKWNEKDIDKCAARIGQNEK